ncbi:3-phosphoshikimate 1-carboxyvinyltransferase [Acidiferrimicrobium sp. IK]|uniref:3-phosphoshikimate 1-carboxyvinyltransferase n=1 Tax=Acidiferrimicrobium sp. IK TaxID=2871700 RepID=UPI0021CAF27D|nr:3-phosphoshikimate 1-carboxyvinyltransferase [Acidiferrimicrobium sp. IK]MCU4184728.1 3-phosphoshikimate 1-carboxyvinyltransferase [Acidiferrimicrobium sp. IK]
MTAFTVEAAPGGVHGVLRVPGDKSVSHRALLLAARADGRSELHGLSDGEDVRHTAEAIQAFGAEVVRIGEGTVAVDGGPARLREPQRVVDVGNSGTAIRLLTGWATAIDGMAVLVGDESIARRPMGRIADPLRLMGAQIDGRAGGTLPPLVVRGGHLHGIEYRPPVASAQVKGAVLLAGLAAEGPTTVIEAIPTRRHTEEMLLQAGADVVVNGGSVTLRPSALSPMSVDVPGDPSHAAFWAVAASIVPGSDLVIEHVYVGPGRAGFIDVLRRMGADIEVVGENPVTRTADLRIRSAALHATEVGGAEVPSLIDEIPVLAVAASLAEGATTFSDAAELAVKESDRIASTTGGLQAIGVRAEARPDGLVVHGRAGRPPAGGSVDALGDHRIAMSMAIAGLVTAEPVRITGWESVATSYPTFREDLRRCVS